MEKIKLLPTIVKPNDVIFNKDCFGYVFKENIITKNSFAWLKDYPDHLIVRISNTKTDNPCIKTMLVGLEWS